MDGTRSSERYRQYLNSPKWRELRDAVMVRAYYRCEVGNCQRPAVEVHHLTYERVYNEDPSDLIAICRSCHDVLTDESCGMVLRCLEEGREGCRCPVCQYQEIGKWLNYKRRDLFAQQVNRYLREATARRYGHNGNGRAKCAGLWKQNLPPDLLCQQTGEPANTPAACLRCDACRWVRAMETDFDRNEREGETDE